MRHLMLHPGRGTVPVVRCAVHARLHPLPTAGRMPSPAPALELARPRKRGRAVEKAEGDAAAALKGRGPSVMPRHRRAE